ncbi:MAG: HNH endonuclease [Cucumibacter sp.]
METMFATQAYRHIGFCIYCGSKRPPLTREHVIPKSLGGKITPVGAHTAAVLGKASCEDCRRVTHAFETYCQRGLFGHLRVRLGMAQREIPNKVSGILRTTDGGFREVAGAPDDLPAFLVLPLFSTRAGLFAPKADAPPKPEFFTREIFTPRPGSPFEYDETGAFVSLRIDQFQRMIAKIALGTAMIRYGPKYFSSIVGPFIRGKEAGLHKYVFGFPSSQEKPPYMSETHLIQIRENSVSGVRYLIGFVRLFAIFGAPTYGVVIGTVNSTHEPERRV